MSNHDGGYLLNYALTKLNKAGAFSTLGPDKTYQIVVEIVKYATRKYDCNKGEILEGLSAALGICANCLQHKEIIVYQDLCTTCCQEWGITKEEIAEWQRQRTPP